MQIARIAICFFALIALGGIALVISHPYLPKMTARSYAERDYQRLVSEGKTEVYVASPELIERIVKDKPFAAKITTVHLSGPNGGTMDFASLRDLPNLSTLEVTYGHQIETLLPTINTMGALRDVRFYYCGVPEIILQSTDNVSLTSLAIHSYQPLTDADQLVRETMDRLPNCTIKLTND
ncbi:MAG: hypothetical protein ACK56W_13685 [Pirellula sp.]|jgi:hypothetical protein|nr:hypothetical protein [Pirellula sp.]